MAKIDTEIEDLSELIVPKEETNIIPFTRSVFRLEDYLDDDPYANIDDQPEPDLGPY